MIAVVSGIIHGSISRIETLKLRVHIKFEQHAKLQIQNRLKSTICDRKSNEHPKKKKKHEDTQMVYYSHISTETGDEIESTELYTALKQRMHANDRKCVRNCGAHCRRHMDRSSHVILIKGKNTNHQMNPIHHNQTRFQKSDLSSCNWRRRKHVSDHPRRIPVASSDRGGDPTRES